MASADEHEAVVAPAEGIPQPRRVGDQRLRCELDSPAWGSQHLGQPGLQRTQVDAMRCGLQPL
jgi:hypothetical protein